MIRSFAERNRIHLRQRADSERVIPGRDGEIYEAGKNQFAVIFMPKRWTPRRWNRMREECKKLGMVCTQDGDTEGTLLFDSENKAHIKAAIDLAHIRRRVQISPETAAKRAAHLRKLHESRKKGPSSA